MPRWPEPIKVDKIYPHSPPDEERQYKKRRDAGIRRKDYREQRRQELEYYRHHQCGKCGAFLSKERLHELENVHRHELRLCKVCMERENLKANVDFDSILNQFEDKLR